jgi:hypothetical protein
MPTLFLKSICTFIYRLNSNQHVKPSPLFGGQFENRWIQLQQAPKERPDHSPGQRPGYWQEKNTIIEQRGQIEDDSRVEAMNLEMSFWRSKIRLRYTASTPINI